MGPVYKGSVGHGVSLYGASWHGISCQGGQLVGWSVVIGASCQGGQLSMGPVGRVVSCPLGQLERVVSCPWGQLSGHPSFLHTSSAMEK